MLRSNIFFRASLVAAGDDGDTVVGFEASARDVELPERMVKTKG
jgi:hypothetical protein